MFYYNKGAKPPNKLNPLPGRAPSAAVHAAQPEGNVLLEHTVSGETQGIHLHEICGARKKGKLLQM